MFVISHSRDPLPPVLVIILIIVVGAIALRGIGKLIGVD